MSHEGRAAFSHIKDLLSQSSQLVIMNEEDPLILYTDASTKAIVACSCKSKMGLRSLLSSSHMLSQIRPRVGVSSWNSIPLREESHSLSLWQAIYGPSGPS